MVCRDNTVIEVPIVLRDRIAAHRRHPRQAYHEVIEEALFFWEEHGAWAPYGPMP